MSAANNPVPGACFQPKLLGYSMVWQVYRTPAGDAQISVQLGTAAPLLRTVRMVVAGLDADRLIERSRNR
jgi:hypothetical protein